MNIVRVRTNDKDARIHPCQTYTINFVFRMVDGMQERQ